MHAQSKDVQFGIIPNGTGNDFVRNLDKFSPRTFVDKLKSGTGKMIDVGKISFESTNRYFLNVADIGFGAKVVETMDRQRKKGIGGKASYSLAILRTFFSYKKQIIAVKGDGIQFKGKSLMLVFSNGTSFGHGLRVFPEAEIDSGKLGLVIIGNVSLYEYVKNLKNLKKGIKISHTEVHYHTFKRLELTVSENIHAETDGEIAGTSSIAVEVIPQMLFLIC
jgi:diacylglycerol kinase (ATP)